jgi:hypothetical protein
MTPRTAGFFIAPFAIDGEPAGLAYRELAALSGPWLAKCGEHLKHGPCFDAPWNGGLHHIQTKFTSAPGVALVTFRAGGRQALSMLLASGHAPEAESEVMHSFVQSLRRVDTVRMAASTPEPFQKAFALGERPLMIVVPLPDDAISDEDHSLVQELAIHTAGSFFAQDLWLAEPHDFNCVP